jgi:sugar/nucleoside kinase (ribokinase family)
MTGSTQTVTCIGLANVDVIANVSEDFLSSHNIAKAATTSLDATSTGMLLGKLANPVFYPGGCAANTACGLSCFDIDTTFIGKTGDDTYADIFRQGFRNTDVRYTTPPFGSKMTSTCLTLVTPDKDRSFALCADTAGWFLSPADLPDSPGQYVYLEANTARMAMNGGNNLLRAAAKKYGGSGIKVIVNLNDREIVRMAHDTLKGLLREDIAFFIGNIAEIHTLFGTNNQDDAFDAIMDTGHNFAVTDGPNGAWVLADSAAEHLPAMRLHASRIVNTIGAGDQFAAGFVSGLVAGLSYAESCLSGIQAATSIIQTISARPEKAQLKKIKS